MKPIRFTAHALEKLTLIQIYGFEVDQDSVVNTVQQPDEVFLGFSGRFIAQTVLDETHVLRVVYEEGEEITVVTLYPGRRGRYEG